MKIHFLELGESDENVPVPQDNANKDTGAVELLWVKRRNFRV